jgi:hypothetical protein
MIKRFLAVFLLILVVSLDAQLLRNPFYGPGGLTLGTVVRMTSPGTRQIAVCGASDIPVGVITLVAATGEYEVSSTGVAYSVTVAAGSSSISAGDYVVNANSGQVKKDDGTGYIVGIALSSGSAGGTIQVFVNIQTAGGARDVREGDILSGTGITVSGGTNVLPGPDATDVTLGLTGQALALHNLGTNGLITRTSLGNVAARTITGGTGITVSNGDGVSANPSIALSNTSVTAGNYGSATQVGTFTVDAQGRLTAAGNTTISGTSPAGSALTSGQIWVGSSTNTATARTMSGDAALNNTGALTLANSGVAAGTYNNVATQVRPFTVDAKGRITSIGAAVNISGVPLRLMITEQVRQIM